MSYPMQPGRTGAPGSYSQIIPNQSSIAPQRGGVAPQRGGIGPQRGGIGPQTAGIAPIPPLPESAPTLAQFWRSGVRRTRPGAQRVRWPGLVAFLVGLLALILLVTGGVAASLVLVSIAFALSLAAGFFALIALIAGLGRVLGFFGILLALAANVYVVGPLFGIV